MSKVQHKVTSRVTASSASDAYHGVGWIDPSPIGSDLSPDADGVFPQYYVVLIDLSHMLSLTLGKQMPMDAVYRVTGLKIGLQNVNDADDNDRGAVFNGYVYWHGATKHKIDAIQVMRLLENNSEEDQIDGDSIFLSGAKQYRGIRYGWDDDDQVWYQTDAFDVNGWSAATGKTDWNLSSLFDIYSDTVDGTQPLRALWQTRVGKANKMRFAVGYNNAMHEDSTFGTTSLIENPQVHDFDWQAQDDRHIDVLGGMLAVEFRGGNTLPNGDASPDDYDIVMEITIEGWSRF